MPRVVAPGLNYWTAAEIGLPAFQGDTVPRGGKTTSRVHYSTGEELGQPDFRAWWRSIHNFHTRPKSQGGRGWLYLGYNFGVARDLRDPEIGHILEGRGWYGVGAHTPGYNTTGLGVCWLGDDDPNVWDVTPGGLRAIDWVIRYGGQVHGNTLEDFPHSATSATHCPADELRGWLARGRPVRPFPGTAPRPAPAPARPRHPAYPGQPLFVLSKGHPQVTWQRRMIQRGWDFRTAEQRRRGVRVGSTGKGDDGAYGPRSAEIAAAFAAEKRLPTATRTYRGRRYVVVDRRLWDAAWTAPVTR